MTYLRALTICLALTVPTVAYATPTVKTSSSATARSTTLRWRCQTDHGCLFTQTKLIRTLASHDLATVRQTQELVYGEKGPLDDEDFVSLVYWGTVLKLAEAYLVVGPRCRAHRAARRHVIAAGMETLGELHVPMDLVVEDAHVFIYGHFPVYRCGDAVHPDRPQTTTP